MTIDLNSNLLTLDYLTEQEKIAIDHELQIMETREACSIEALKIVQLQRGWISDDSLHAIAAYLRIPSADLEGVATFYNLIYRQPVGKYVIHICNSISCHLCGYDAVVSAIKNYLAIEYGQTTSDGMFTLLSNACLGACDQAPVMMIDNQLYQSLTPQNVVDILQTLQAADNKGVGR
ncbi:NADH-quinone oxidoreductase subunit NuoE [Thalassotalea sp. 1_MG-2023]|uniref:NADH-quinone oxidoreductase subunit NuoE n=1 Tax=Thalassotalea sp. 1_MG-2023 TaxID=3062680 RepID=UPI0026E17525|nr:NADH-quinone oxidoreductase subunit NuoE [Thalassotalea sp. 1_MG-2023]MDO6426585.1 NADH-quinone oxidoreductase subunit NuoE [Thalassotalea sp. 1_MG-2023]